MVPRPSRQSLLAIAALLAAALGTGLYYHVQIRASRDYFTQRNFRVLAVASRQVTGSLQAVMRMMEADLRQVLDDSDTLVAAERVREQRRRAGKKEEPVDDDRIACGEPPDPEDCPHLDATLCQGVGRGLKQALQLRRCLVNQDTGSTALPQIDFIDYTVKALGPDPGSAAPVRRIELLGGGRAKLVFPLSKSATSGSPAFSVEGVAQADLPALVEPFLVPGVFASVLLLANDGHVLMAAATDLQVRRLDFEKESAEKATAEKKGEATSGGKETPKGSSLFATRLAPQPPPTQLPGVKPLEIAGRSYLAFCQPLELANATPGVAGLCGLTAASAFQADSVALSPYWLVALTSFLVLGALSWPLLKIVFVGVGERVRVFDLVSLGLSLFMGAGLITLLFLDLAASFDEIAPLGREAGLSPPRGGPPASALQVDRHLAVLAASLKEGIEKEMGDALLSLDTLAHIDDARLAEPRTRRLAAWSETPPVGFREEPFLPAETFKSLAYRLIDTATWIDPAGRQVVKWSTQKYRSPLNDVGDRNYFINAKNDLLWRRGEISYFAEVVRSRSTGEPRLLLSTHPASTPKDLAVAAVAVSSPAVAAVGTVLPPGYGFALLQADGRTVLHSEDRHAMDENFLEETDGSPALRAALFSRTRALFSARYWGTPHRILALPLERAPWTLAVFYESDLSRTAHLEILTLAAFLLLALLLLLGVWTLLGRWIAGAGGQPWLWPLRGGTVRYAGLAAFFLATAGFVVTFGHRTLAPAFLLPLAAAGLATAVLPQSAVERRRLQATAVLVGVPLALFAWILGSAASVLTAAALLVAALALARKPGLLSGVWVRRPWAPRVVYIAWALAAMFAMSTAPAASLYRAASEHYAGLYVQHALLDMARRLDEHPGARDTPLATPGQRGGYRFFYGGDLVRDPVRVEASTCVPRGTDPLPEAAPSLVPLYNPHSIRLRGLGAGSAADGGWSAGWTPDGTARCLGFHGTQSGSTYVLASASGTTPGTFSVWPLLGLLLVAALVALLLQRLARRLFLLDFKDPETVSLLELAEGPIRSNLLVICAPLSRKEQLLARPDLLLVDLQGDKRTPADVELLLKEHPRPRILCFDRFEVALHSAGQRRALLTGLEVAVCVPGPPILLLAETDPEPALGLEGAPRAAEGTAEAETRRRWAQLLGRFVRVVAVDRGEPEAFAEDVARAESQAMALAPEGSPPGRTREAFATLRRECLHHYALQQAGQVLLDRPDFPTFDRDRVVRYVRELADSYYRGLWFSLPDVQKLLLHQIADGDLVSLNAGRALNRLLALRLVVRDPNIRIVNESLARFVNTATTRDEVRSWQRAEGASAWGYMRVPVLITLVTAAGLLVYSQPDTLLAVLTSIGAVIPLMAKLLDLLRTQKPQTQS